MQRRLNLLYLSIILLPVAALAFFGIRAAAGEQNRLRRAQERLWRSELETLEGDMFLELEGMEESLQNLVIGSPSDIEGLRELNRNLSWVRQIFIISPDGEFLFPPRESAGMMEENFFLRTAPLWQGGISFHQVIEGEDSTSADSGWRPYYEGMNVSFLYWMKRDDGTIVGFDIYREQILSQLLLFLSDPDLMDQDPQDYKLFMRDEKGALTSISGQYSAYEDQRSLLTYHLREPLGGWRFEVFISPRLMEARRTVLPLILTAAALVVALIGAGFLYWRESTREIREARTRVSFVNQVSHELKTPLTNIRMYSEMMESSLPAESREKEFAGIIQRESERLTRMIQNVLSFSREKKKLHKTAAVPDELIKRILDALDPRLQDKGIHVNTNLNTSTELSLDTDLFEQILWNLVSNVEKYGASGKYLGVNSFLEETLLVIEVHDKGPGIPGALQQKIFQPFVRGSDDITEGVSGTGLGLPISRELARRHGGDLVFHPCDKGSCFRLTLEVGTE